MVQLVVFINLFFIPVLPLYVIYKKRQRPLRPNLDLLFHYCIATVCNIPLTKLFVFLIKKTVGAFIPIDSGFYTMAALLPTVLLILSYKFYITYPDHAPWKNKIIQKGIKGVVKDIAPACVLLFVSCFMLLVFEPILMYATNINDFWFDLQLIIGPILRIFIRFFLIGTVLIFVVYNADLLLSKRLLLYKGIILIGFIAFFLVYLQGNWLAGALPRLTGAEIAWENYGKRENAILASAALILVGVMVISIRKHGLNRTVFYTTAGSFTIFVMLFASLVPTVIASGALETKDTEAVSDAALDATGVERSDTFAATLRNYNNISSNTNFLIFLLDATDSQMFYNVMMGDDEFRDILDDFTYYPDTLSIYPFTGMSIPNILTGTAYYADMNVHDYRNRAYNQSPLFEKLTQNGYEINLYSTVLFWKGNRDYAIENSASIVDVSVDLNVFMAEELKYIKYKYYPYGLKRLSNIETLDFNNCIITTSQYDLYSWGSRETYERITENSVLDKQDQNYFQFIHCEGGHLPYILNRNLDIVKEATQEDKMLSCLTLIQAYLQRLRDNGAYDNSIIVIMADHGQEDGAIDEEHAHTHVMERFNPILFIKGINERHELLESDRSVSYMDLQDAFCDLIDGKQSTELFADLEPGRKRTILSHITSTSFTEYETTGKAWEVEKYTPTGNVYNYGQ